MNVPQSIHDFIDIWNARVTFRALLFLHRLPGQPLIPASWAHGRQCLQKQKCWGAASTTSNCMTVSNFCPKYLHQFKFPLTVGENSPYFISLIIPKLENGLPIWWLWNHFSLLSCAFSGLLRGLDHSRFFCELPIFIFPYVVDWTDFLHDFLEDCIVWL